jgi:hypothetical protein
MPLVRPTLTAGSQAPILVSAQTPEGLKIGVEARVVTDDGEPVEVRDIQWHRPLQSGLDGVQWIPATFSAAGLAAGDYRLEVTASWGGTSTTQTRAMDFTVED